MTKMIDFGYRCVGSIVDGNGYFERKPDQVTVYEDTTTYAYHVCRGELREFKRWVAATYGKKVVGNYPDYEVRGE